MVIIRDLQGNIIGKEASASYTPTRKLRAAHEQKLCDAQMGIDRTAEREARQTARQSRQTARLARQLEARGMELPPDGHALSLVTGEVYKVRSCNCEDYPCCGH